MQQGVNGERSAGRPVPPATSTASASWSPAAAGAQALLQDEVRQAGTAAGPAADQQQAGGLGMSLQPSAAGGQGSMGCSSRGRDGASYGGSHANAISLGWRDKYKEQDEARESVGSSVTSMGGDEWLNVDAE
ncbi:hypothetical protein HaLaN_27022 [Haematococcus lacustris]|uniref:Uncharacterized protein n=1 Tax=Haematococcus lacustris TaxID=44745 RepID=A0A6A0A8S0_HAELA|nr:hypothetical protein HaLaN_27022 [Haematococcus lacustris]